MSAHKKKGVVATKTGMVVGGGKGKRGHNVVTFKLGAIFLSVAILALGATILVTHHKKSTVSNTTSGVQNNPLSNEAAASSPENKQAAAINEDLDKALDLAFNGKPDEAQALFDAKLAQTKDAKTRAQIYDDKSVVAFNAKNYTQALDFGQQSEELNPTAASAGDVAIASEALGDKTTALKYYNLQLQRQSVSSRGIRGANDSLKAKIKELEN